MRATPVPTLRQLHWARRAYERNDPGDLFYRAATDLVGRVLKRQSTLTLAEALAVLLQTWNASFYRFRGGFSGRDFRRLTELLVAHRRELAQFRERSIGKLTHRDQEIIERLFARFERVLGPVGASKCLHLLAPNFFPLWDQEIARRYGFPLYRQYRAQMYVDFMRVAKRHIAAFGGRRAIGMNAMKAWDEFNYCTYTLPSL